MAQIMVDLKRLKNKVNVSTQTGENEYFITLSKSKHAKLKYSSAYKDMVLSFNINKSKHFIITRQMWKILRNHLEIIDQELNKNGNFTDRI